MGSLVRRLIVSADGSWLGASSTPQLNELKLPPGEGLAGRTEFEDGHRFFQHFRGNMTPSDLTGREILDLGCGYGGRTIYYVENCGATHAHGVEISSEVVGRCRQLAGELSCSSASFSVGFAENLRFPNASFDAVVSFDVLEHVEDPISAIGEIARVLRPGGMAWLVFPTYLGARSSHLDYVTRVPGLHRIFDPDVIIEAVNQILDQEPGKFGVAPQPRPTVTSLGRRVLPTLNGMTLREARAIVGASGLTTVDEALGPLIPPKTPLPGSWLVGRLATAACRLGTSCEFLVGSVALSLRKD